MYEDIRKDGHVHVHKILSRSSVEHKDQSKREYRGVLSLKLKLSCEIHFIGNFMMSVAASYLYL